jgi:peptide/nickel transport system permease protein
VSAATARAAAPRRGLARLARALAPLYARRSAAFGTTVVLLFVLVALLGPALAPYGANEQVYAEARRPPSLERPFGTDHLGRDVFSRVVLGTRDIFLLAGVGTALAVVLGTTIGLLTSYLGGLTEELTFRIFDAVLAMPALLFALLLLGTFGPSRSNVLAVIAVAYVPIVARVVRSVVLGVKTKDYIAAARMQGETLGRILVREILPSVLPALAVEGALRFSYAIFLVASLGFLGAGVQPPNPDWGLMISEGRNFVSLTPWALYFPAAAISLLVVSVNLMADGLKTVLQGGS